MFHVADLRRLRVPSVWRWALLDAVVAVVLLVVTIEQQEAASPVWLLLPLLMAVAVAIRRWRTVTAVVLACLGAVGHHADPTAHPILLDLAVPLALYTLASAHPRRRSAFVFGGVLVAACLLTAVQLVTVPVRGESRPDLGVTTGEKARLAEEAYFKPGAPILDKPEPSAPTFGDLVGAAVGQTIVVLLMLGLAFAIGDSVRSRRLHLRTLVKRAEDLEREQHQRVALATAAERARITRELHDVVAHGLSVMVVQAQGGAAALQRHPDRTAAALDNVITTGRASLAEMRRLLEIVRDDPAEGPQLAPQPGVAALPDLVDRVRAAGTPVTFTVDGAPVPLPTTVDLSAYRITQEALTNTIKHAGSGARAVVRLGFDQDSLSIEVSDDGAASATPSSEGNGLRGIAERISLLGGRWSAGPGEAGGFVVRAVLPLRAPA
ncbi:sensor histidine kinase [Phytohabitans flavus]|uniref:sensor histidine kinase n=1 Tax=Phytohabitans flavus TaxID=1076124 RepID=UPI0031ED7EF0